MEDATHVSFSDVVRAHYAWDKQNGEHSREAYENTIERFQRDEGEIVDAYWCRKDASAVALTRKRITRGRLALGDRQEDEYRLFRVSDWVTGGGSEIANLLHECDVLAIKAAKGLEGIQQAVAMQWLQAVEAHLLGFIERHRDSEPNRAETERFVRRQRVELSRIEDYYQSAGEKRARMYYVRGMLLGGVPAVAVLAVILGGILQAFGAPPLDTDTILESIRRTGRLVVAQEAVSPCSFASEVCALAAEHCLRDLKAPPVRVTSPFINVPTPVPLAEARAPGADDVVAAVRTVMGKG